MRSPATAASHHCAASGLPRIANWIRRQGSRRNGRFGVDAETEHVPPHSESSGTWQLGRALAAVDGIAAGRPPWLAREPGPAKRGLPGHKGPPGPPWPEGTVEFLVAPHFARLGDAGARYEPMGNCVDVSSDLGPAPTLNLMDLGPGPYTQPGRLAFEHVEPRPDNPADTVAVIVLAREILRRRRPAEECPIVSEFLEAWPEVPRSQAAKDGMSGDATLPMPHWPACVWIATVEGDPAFRRVCRQPLAPGGVPLGPARTWPMPPDGTADRAGSRGYSDRSGGGSAGPRIYATFAERIRNRRRQL